METIDKKWGCREKNYQLSGLIKSLRFVYFFCLSVKWGVGNFSLVFQIYLWFIFHSSQVAFRWPNIWFHQIHLIPPETDSTRTPSSNGTVQDVCGKRNRKHLPSWSRKSLCLGDSVSVRWGWERPSVASPHLMLHLLIHRGRCCACGETYTDVPSVRKASPGNRVFISINHGLISIKTFFTRTESVSERNSTSRNV